MLLPLLPCLWCTLYLSSSSCLHATLCRTAPAPFVFLSLLLCYVLHLVLPSFLYAVRPLHSFPSARQAGHTPVCVLGVTWRCHVSPCPAMLEAWSVKPSLYSFGHTLPCLGRGRTKYQSFGGQHFMGTTIPGLSQERCCVTTQADFSVFMTASHVTVPFILRPDVSRRKRRRKRLSVFSQK